MRRERDKIMHAFITAERRWIKEIVYQCRGQQFPSLYAHDLRGAPKTKLRKAYDQYKAARDALRPTMPIYAAREAE